jgi:homospermidine synthase
MKADSIHASFPGRLIMLGFGSIGQATLPLLFRHFAIRPEQIKIIAADPQGQAIAEEFAVEFLHQVLTEANYREVLTPLLHAHDFLLNLSVDVSSLALLEFCRSHHALYLDTCTEPWAGGYTNTSKSVAQRSNYALREEVLALRRHPPGGPTAVITQGANPGLASAFVKQALINIATDTHVLDKQPEHAEDWAALAQRLGVKVIHVAERDTQTTSQRKQRDEFVNTWSVPGFISEATQPSELGWGTHELYFPEDAAQHSYGCAASIYLNRPSAATRVRSWTPLEGSYHGFLITHSESISIADCLTLRNNEKVIYRPTVNYAYHPCDDAMLSLHEMAGKNWQPQTEKRIIRDDITEGTDELGVLLMGHAKNAYWYGSRLSIQQARQLAPYNNATSLQVVAGVLAGLVWALRNPNAGLVEPDDIDYKLVLEIARPYLGDMVGVYSDWTPLKNRGRLFDEDLDREGPWQFKNFRVT